MKGTGTERDGIPQAISLHKFLLFKGLAKCREFLAKSLNHKRHVKSLIGIQTFFLKCKSKCHFCGTFIIMKMERHRLVCGESLCV